jgi:UDP-N-acetylglucosamine 2-epimerase (non-hydrolysing)
MAGLKIASVGGARPNFIKIAPLMRAFGKYAKRIYPILIHTGQHYDFMLSQHLFHELEIPTPDFHLNVGSGSHAEQTAGVMVELEWVLLAEKPDLVVVVGDVNSTLAAALTAAKLEIPVAHVEAGLRSRDRSMPEEINRLVTDCVSDFLFAPSQDACENLLQEGVPQEKIYLVGNIMIDCLLHSRKHWEASLIHEKLGLNRGGNEPESCRQDNVLVDDYVLVTLHRPSNVDDPEVLERILCALREIQKRLIVIFPAHPRTLRGLREGGAESPNRLLAEMPNLILIEPLGYLDFIHLEAHARIVLTDSGGVQEETTVLNVPCLTLRENTERPITISMGTNVLVGTDPDRILMESIKILDGHSKKGQTPPLWDGRTAERIMGILLQKLLK